MAFVMPKRKWEEDCVPPAIRKKIKLMDQPTVVFSTEPQDLFLKIDQWASESSQNLVDLLVAEGSGSYDVGRVIAALDEIKHVKNIARDAILLK
jgi:hypothetical protein